MGWTYFPRHGRKVTDLVVEAYAMDNERAVNEILAHSINVRVGVAYLAVKTTLKATGVSYVWAGVALIKLVPRDHYDFGIKEMDETMGPVEADCPARVLDLLTPLDTMAALMGETYEPDPEKNWALKWRQVCRANIARKAARGPIVNGTIITLTAPVRFSDGRERGTFKVVKTGRTTRYLSLSDGCYVSLSRRLLDAATVEGA